MEQCTFYKWGESHFFGPSVCTINDKRVPPKQVRDCCKGICNNYYKCPHYINRMTNNNIFATILNHVLLDKHNKDNILNTMMMFRKNILEKNVDYKYLLVYHDRMSTIIVDAINNTNRDMIKDILEDIYKNYILKIHESIINKDNKAAIVKYKEMFNLIIKYFSLEEKFEDVKKQYKHPEKYGRYALKKVM